MPKSRSEKGSQSEAAARSDGRSLEQARAVEFQLDFTKWAEGSVLVSFGDTRVLCTCSIEDRLPHWMKEQKRGSGWMTAEYAMLPRATDRRSSRESVQGKIGGRTHEISRLIGRALRAGADLTRFGERTATLDCDVLQADGGTRTASITGGWVAAWIAFQRLVGKGVLQVNPLKHHVAAISLGIVEDEILLDLSFEEDQRADTDLNLVMNDQGGIIEIQGTAEGKTFSKVELDRIIEIGQTGIEGLVLAQRAAIARFADAPKLLTR